MTYCAIPNYNSPYDCLRSHINCVTLILISAATPIIAAILHYPWHSKSPLCRYYDHGCTWLFFDCSRGATCSGILGISRPWPRPSCHWHTGILAGSYAPYSVSASLITCGDRRGFLPSGVGLCIPKNMPRCHDHVSYPARPIYAIPPAAVIRSPSPRSL